MCLDPATIIVPVDFPIPLAGIRMAQACGIISVLSMLGCGVVGFLQFCCKHKVLPIVAISVSFQACEYPLKDADSKRRYWPKLQALVYDSLPSTTAVFSYAIESRKLSANEQGFFFCVCVCSNSSKFVTTQIISDVCFILPCYLRQLK